MISKLLEFIRKEKDEGVKIRRKKGIEDIYILTEKNKEILKDYLDTYNINVSDIFDDIEEVKIKVLTNSQPIRLIIIEYGLGRFSSAKNKEEIIDLIGMCESDDNDVIVYYTRPVIKSKSAKSTWIKLKNTGKVVDDIKNYYC